MLPATSEIDLFGDDAPTWYGMPRDTGPVVYLPRKDLYAITHDDVVRAALRAHDVLIGSRGVPANDILNTTDADTALTSDGAVHSRRCAMFKRLLEEYGDG